MTQLLVNIEDKYIDCLRDMAQKRNIATGEAVKEIVEAFMNEKLVPVLELDTAGKDGKACSNCEGLCYRAKKEGGKSCGYCPSLAEPFCKCGRAIGYVPELVVCPLWQPRKEGEKPEVVL